MVRFLRYRQENWKRQRAIDGYIVDFFCYSARLVIELDGSQHYTEEGEEYDSIRTEVLERYQLEVMRFLNSEVDRNFDYVCLAIEEKVRERTGSPF
ncbi:endonuclease domain-containing protein [uncultured Ruminococcus sp.]|uniref:endonuclease domain-containing protein n=1 Tax=uncultured Ruminococcus sp. TaxID=165186 RepID=UPI00266C71A7|nr:endonuclease domain-containing protein [uncultured Ruminococcus sp.]